MSTELQKVEIVSTNAEIRFDDDDKSLKIQNLMKFVMDESLSTIPIFMKYFAFHECVVLSCGGLYHLQRDIGVLFLSILPGISIIGIFIHFLITQFETKRVKETFRSMKHYVIAFIVFVIGACSIYLIYETNTYLSRLVPSTLIPEISTSTEIFIAEILKFPYNHSMKGRIDEAEREIGAFNYRVSFVGSIIAPIIEESFKYFVLSLTFPISFLWSFSGSYHSYCVQSLFIIFVGVCGGGGIAIMENMGYLAACEWASTKQYCLPNRNFDILGAGLARGIFSVPFHCVTAGIMADIVCCWMNTEIPCFHKNSCIYIIKFILSYPLSIVLPAFLHSSFNYWMKGIPIMTGFFTIIGFSWLSSRIAKKHSFISDEIGKNKKELMITMKNIDETAIHLSISQQPL